jgi:hypothetical protein
MTRTDPFPFSPSAPDISGLGKTSRVPAGPRLRGPVGLLEDFLCTDPAKAATAKPNSLNSKLDLATVA